MARAAMLHGWRTAPHVIIPGGWTKTLIFIVVAPLMGFVLGFGFMVAVSWIFQHKAPRQVDKLFRKLQLLSAAAYSLGHGGNDAQKTMGIVAGALYTAGVMSNYDLTHNWGHLHWPIILAAHAAIALGTYFGGWRIVHTMGSKITKLKPVGGFCAESPAPSRSSAPPDGDPRQHHAHHHRSHRRCRHHQSPLGRALGRRHPHRLGLGDDDSLLCPGGGAVLLALPDVQSSGVRKLLALGWKHWLEAMGNKPLANAFDAQFLRGSSSHDLGLVFAYC